MSDTPTVTPNGTVPLMRLCALDTLFTATGTVDVRVGSHTVTLPIQSVDMEDVTALVGKAPRAPMFYKRENGQEIRVRDLADPTFTDNLDAYNRKLMLAWVCMAISIDICDRAGSIVWSADNRVHDLEAARQALKAMGIVDNQLTGIFTAVRALTDSTQAERVSD